MLLLGVDDLRDKFYNAIRGKHVLIVVSEDVDALCGAAILSKLFRCDDISFSICPVCDWSGLGRILRDHQEQNPAIVLINCGGTRGLTEMLPPESAVYIMDSRRPIHHENIFSNEAIYVVLDQNERDEMNIPDYTEIYPPDSDSENSSEDEEDLFDDEEDAEEGEGGGGRRKNKMNRIERRIIKKDARKQFEKRSRNLLLNFYQHTWYSMSTAVRMLELASSLNRASAEFMWYAAVGLNSQFTDRLISTEVYTTVCYDRMRKFLHKYSPKEVAKADDVLRIGLEKELPLAMYTHWSLFSAMKFDEYFACETKNWTQRGDNTMKHMMSDLGLTLTETKQKYEAMATERRKEVFDILERKMAGGFVSFTAHLGFGQPVSASDVARAASIKLETPHHLPIAERFAVACELLTPFSQSNGDFSPLSKAIDAYKHGMEATWIAVASGVSQNEITGMGPFYLYSSQRHLDSDLFESRHFLYKFSFFLQSAFVASGRNRGRKPLIVSFPLAGERNGWILVTGVMPRDSVFDDNVLKSFIGRAFREVARRSTLADVVLSEHFDSDIILLRGNDRQRFFDHLQAVMEIEDNPL